MLTHRIVTERPLVAEAPYCMLELYCQRAPGSEQGSSENSETQHIWQCLTVCVRANMLTKLCSGDEGAKGEAEVVPAEPAPHIERAGGRVPGILC